MLYISSMENKNIRELTKDKLEIFWNEHSEYLKYTFGRKVIADIAKFKYDVHQNQELVKNYIELNERGTSQLRQFNRLNYGYNALGGKLTPGVIGLHSRATLDDKDTTHDHIFGVTAVGWKVHTIIKELFDEGRSTKFIHDYMTEEWLPNHLYYWCQVKITKEEHKKDNLARDEHTLDEKENLIHYNEASIELLI